MGHDDPTAATGTRGPSSGSSHGPREGDSVGSYKLLRQIGEGGFGVVWLAERREPMVQRVALKVIKPGMDSRAVVARFEQERQALAVMDHPNVARVFDGGVTERGLPYFVLEHVAGEPITTFCDRHRYTIRQRLELFVPVCDAVQHAHMKGIIHRDLKPSNILVALQGEHAVPKVIDFGVAKAISHTLTDKTIFTETGQIIGTPEYMSPEQAEMGAMDIDTRTDVYSLGVVLYELLSGVLPFDPKTLREAGYAEIQRIIREEEAPRPSTRLSTADDQTAASIARLRQDRREHLASELRRELDWIPLKALRKDRARRYASAESLATDVRRYLEGKPLEAAPESRAYLLRKFVKRNRGPVVAGTAVLGALALGVAGVAWQGARAERARVRAEHNEAEAIRQRTIAAQSTLFLRELIAQGSAESADGGRMSVRDAVRLASARVDLMEWKDPLVEASVLTVLAGVLGSTQDYELAQSRAERAVAIYERLGVRSPEHAEALAVIASAWDARQNYENAIEFGEKAAAMIKPFMNSADASPAIAETWASITCNLGNSTFQSGYPARPERKAQGIRVVREALEQSQQRGVKADIQSSIAGVLGQLLSIDGQGAQARSVLEASIASLDRTNPGHPGGAMSRRYLADLLMDAGELERAEGLYRDALDQLRARTAFSSPDFADTLQGLSNVLVKQGRTREARAVMEEQIRSREKFGLPFLLSAALFNLSKVCEADGDMDGAVAAVRRIDEECMSTKPLSDWARGRTRQRMAQLWMKQGKHQEAASVLVAMEPVANERAAVQSLLAEVYAAWDKAEPGNGYDTKAAEWKAKSEASKRAADESKK